MCCFFYINHDQVERENKPNSGDCKSIATTLTTYLYYCYCCCTFCPTRGSCIPTMQFCRYLLVCGKIVKFMMWIKQYNDTLWFRRNTYEYEYGSVWYCSFYSVNTQNALHYSSQSPTLTSTHTALLFSHIHINTLHSHQITCPRKLWHADWRGRDFDVF